MWRGAWHSPKSIRVSVCFIIDWIKYMPDVRSARRLRLCGGESGPMINFIFRHFASHWPLMWVVSLHIVTVGCALRCMRPSRRVHTLFGTDNNRNQFSWPNFVRAITTTANQLPIEQMSETCRRISAKIHKSKSLELLFVHSFRKYWRARAPAQYKFHRKWAFVNGKNENYEKVQ